MIPRPKSNAAGAGFFIKCGVKPAAPVYAHPVVRFANLEWLVLDARKGRRLLLTKNAIESRVYDDANMPKPPEYYAPALPVTWETCSLRKYLNGEFLERFTAKQRKRIAKTKVVNPDNLWYGTPGGAKTVDKVFLLSAEELDRYFGDSGDYLNKRRHTGEAVGSDPNGFGIFMGRGASIFSNSHDAERVAMCRDNRRREYWWLRSPGGDRGNAVTVCAPGCACLNGAGVNLDYGVRPALWLKPASPRLRSLIFGPG